VANYTYQQLQQLWINNGGNPTVASLMAAIAMAESGGNSQATNPSSGAAGIWQIYPPEPGSYDPSTNAKIAVRKYNDQGLGAWEAYTNGSYHQYLQDGASGVSTLSSSSSVPCVTTEWKFASVLGHDFGSMCLDPLVGGGAAIVGLFVSTAGLIILAIFLFSGTGVGKAAGKAATAFGAARLIR
jgi:Transglycosylase SLT domain